MIITQIFFFLDNDIVNFRTSNSSSNKPVFSNIVTLNYDLVIEYIFERKNSKAKRGFIRDSIEDDAYLPLEKDITQSTSS